jgi:hypothetical protein
LDECGWAESFNAGEEFESTRFAGLMMGAAGCILGLLKAYD